MKKKIGEELILAYTLKNAIEHDGKARLEAVLNSLFHEGLEKSRVKKTIPKIQKIVNKVNKLTKEEQEKQFSKLEKQISKRKTREGLPELPNAKKGIITRFSPSPSGPMHIGHALTGLPSSLYIKKYGGKFYLRIEDTNPENIYPPAYKMLKQEADWLFGNVTESYAQSNRMEKYYRFAENLIRKRFAYVCTCSQEKFKNLVLQKKPCPCRDLGVKENSERWKKMLAKDSKSYKEGEAVLRFKSGMKHKNPAMRDFPLARINLTKHPLQKNKYRVWPLMNLAVTLDDIEYKVTHIIRAKDHRDNAKRQEMIFRALGRKYPWNAFLGRLHFKDLELSTTKMRQAIEQGEYSGWEDSRLPTIASLKKQGFKPQAFWKLSESIGLSEVDKTMDKKEFFNLLRQFNR